MGADGVVLCVDGKMENVDSETDVTLLTVMTS